MPKRNKPFTAYIITRVSVLARSQKQADVLVAGLEYAMSKAIPRDPAITDVAIESTIEEAAE